MSIATVQLATSVWNPSPVIEKSETPAKPTASEPADRDLRRIVSTELRALLTKGASQRENDFRSTLESVRAALVAFERTCETVTVQLSEHPSVSASAVSELVERFVGAATRDTEAAVQRTRAQAQVEIALLEDLVARLEVEKLTARDQLKIARENTDRQRDACARAENACEEARREGARIGAAFEVRMQALQAELEAERTVVSRLKLEIDVGDAERAQLVAAVETVRRAVSFGSAEAPSWEPVPPHSSPHRELTDLRDLGSRPVTTSMVAENHTPAESATQNQSVDAFDNSHASETPPDPALLARVHRLFAELERMYYLDVESESTPADVIDRLIANLRSAHSELRQSCHSDIDPDVLFEQHMMMLLDVRGGTSFARHLGIAAYQFGLER
jgi:hypothetical protein